MLEDVRDKRTLGRADLDSGSDRTDIERLEFLADRANDGLLTVAERAEYEAINDELDIVATRALKTRRHASVNRKTAQPSGPNRK